MTRRAAVIMAAGQGTRMKSPVPKVLHKVGGRAILDRVIDTVQASGCERIVVVVGNHSHGVRALVEARLHPLYGEVPVARFIPAADGAPTALELRNHCRQHLAAFKVPKRVTLCRQFPRTPLGKVRKFLLLEENRLA